MLRETPDSAFYEHASRQSSQMRSDGFKLDDEEIAKLDSMTPEMLRTKYLGPPGFGPQKRAAGFMAPPVSDRPKTAPLEVFKFRQQQLQEMQENTRPALRACSHDTKEMPNEVFDATFAVKKLGHRSTMRGTLCKHCLREEERMHVLKRLKRWPNTAEGQILIQVDPPRHDDHIPDINLEHACPLSRPLSPTPNRAMSPSPLGYYRLIDNRPWSRVSSVSATSVPVVEYLSITAPKTLAPPGSAAPSRAGSALSQMQIEHPINHLNPVSREEELVGSDLDLPDMDDLDDDLRDMPDEYDYDAEEEKQLEETNMKDSQADLEQDSARRGNEELDELEEATEEGEDELKMKKKRALRKNENAQVRLGDSSLSGDDSLSESELARNSLPFVSSPTLIADREDSRADINESGNSNQVLLDIRGELPRIEETGEDTNRSNSNQIVNNFGETPAIHKQNLSDKDQAAESEYDAYMQDVVHAQTIREEINALLEPKHGVRASSAHSRVTFQDEIGRPLSSSLKVCSRPSSNQPHRSILVQAAPPQPHIVEDQGQPQDSGTVGLTIRQYRRATDDDVEKPSAAKPKPSIKQLLQQQAHDRKPLLDKRKPLPFRRGKTFSSFNWHQQSSDSEEETTQEKIIELKVDGGQIPKRARSAGFAPTPAQSTNKSVIMHRQKDMLKKVPILPQRPSAPSIPSPYMFRLDRGASQGTYQPQLEKSARQDRSPRHYMHKIGNLRTPSGPDNSETDGQTSQVAGSLSNFLSISQKPVTRGTARESLFTQSSRSPSCAPSTPPPTEYGTLSDNLSHFSGQVDRSHTPIDERVTRLYISYETASVQSGRPIPDYAKCYTPEEYAEAMRKQLEAKAAVSIQKFFRGYVARTNYKYLLKEERDKKIDQQIAAKQIQRAYRKHLQRTMAIYKRKPGQEMQQWGQELGKAQALAQAQREEKAKLLKEQHLRNKTEAEGKLSVIGPHIEVYDPFHPKKLGPDRMVLYKAAACIQRWVRGWLIRIKIQALQRKSKQHAPTWAKFVEDYKALLRRIQRRVGISRPSAMVHLSFLNVYMESKSRYEDCFESRAFSGELEIVELMDYFNECNLYPSESEVDETLHLIFRGTKLKLGRGLLRHQVLELTFQLYPPQPGLIRERKSTWMHPIINGQEANKFLASDNIEKTDFKTTWNLVSNSMRERVEHDAIIETEEEPKHEEKARKSEGSGRSSSDTSQKKKQSTAGKPKRKGSGKKAPPDKKVTFQQ